MSLSLAVFQQFVHRQPFLQIAVAAMESLKPHFEHPWKLTAQPGGSTDSETFPMTLETKDPTDGNRIPVMVMKFGPGYVAIPNVFLPDEFKHRGAMITALRRMVEVAEEQDYKVVVCDLVPRYQRSLLRRGALQLEVSDAVLLHADMDFQPSNGPTP